MKMVSIIHGTLWYTIYGTVYGIRNIFDIFFSVSILRENGN